MNSPISEADFHGAANRNSEGTELLQKVMTEMKKVLITGANSYIGTSFEAWAKKRYPGEFEIDTVDMVDGSWKEKSFRGYTSVFHVAAIVHKKEKPEMKNLYWQVNKELPVEVAQKAKEEGVHQFVFMSSMSVYGMNTGSITKETKAHPKTFYGKSKLAAEKELRKLADDKFSVAILRPPMVYGVDCKGNYQLLKKFALMSPVFPKYENQRSMISIERLCDFVVQTIQEGKGGLYFPQNKHYVCTTKMVQEIARDSGKKIWTTRIFNPFISLGLKMHVSVIEKMFGNLVYERKSQEEERTNIKIAKAEQKKMILVSIVTVAYNSEKTIQDTIESVLNQTYPNIEYLIVDGLSTDDTVKIARSYEKKFEEKGYKYKVISEKDNGIYDAMNKGIKASTGELIGIINSDDWYELDAVETVVKQFAKINFDMLYADLRVIKEDGSKFVKHSCMRKFVTTRDWNHPTTFMNRKVYDSYLYKCESLYDDMDMMLKVREDNREIVVINKILANFRLGGVSNQKQINKIWERCKARYRIYRNHGFSRLYWFECLFMEFGKAIVG